MAASVTTTQQQFQPMSLPSVLSSPLTNRGELLARLFAESSLKELAAAFPVILEDIFGFGGRPGWNLQLITRKCHPAEFDKVRALLQPAGPLFSVIYRLMAEPHVTYEFPAACLPSNPAGGGGGLSSLSAGHWSLLGPQSPGGGQLWGGSLMLGPLELYLHHFCYFLLNPAQKAAPIAWTSPGDALFPTLLEDLMTHFLPCTGGWVTPLNHPPGYHPHHHHHHLHQPGVARSPELPRLVTPPRLLLRSALLRPLSPGGPGSSPPGGTGLSHGHLMPETWRSEALLRTAVAFWLETGAQSGEQKPPSPGQNDSFSAKSILYELNPLVPSHDHVRVVRMLVKHLHFFANAKTPPGLEEFKRQSQSLLQKKLYAFTRHTIQHWPTDTSFRLILETWLSYIQPWRYTDYANRNRSPTQPGQPRESDRLVDDSWARFVAENLLFYVTIFRQLLPRLQRMELTVPKYAYMVFRLAKVMCQPGLSSLIRSAEELLHSGSRWSAGRSAPSPAGQSSLLYAAAVGQHIIDLEEPGFTYQSLFDASCTQQVHGLIARLSEARAALDSHLACLPPPASERGSLWGGLLAALGANSPDHGGAEMGREETRRAVIHLESAAAQMAKLYNLDLPEPTSLLDSPSTPPNQRLPSHPFLTPHPGHPLRTPLAAGLPTPSVLKSPPPCAAETELTPHGPRLTARGRQQLLSGLCRGDVEFRGDPERRPVQSAESAAVLRVVQAVSGHVNTAYGAELASLYHRADLLGYICRCVLLPPAVFYELTRGPGGRSERRAVSRPASLSLRPLADQRALAGMAGGVVAVMSAGWSPGGALVMLVMVGVVLVVLVAVVRMGRDWWKGCEPEGLGSPQR